MNFPAKIAPGVITMDDVELLFEALPDADQVRFLAARLSPTFDREVEDIKETVGG
jgi:hypothetical protein